jgi:hypothetical protein
VAARTQGGLVTTDYAGAISQLSGNTGSFQFTAATGTVNVANEGYQLLPEEGLPPAPPADFLRLQAVADSGRLLNEYPLNGIRLYWTETDEGLGRAFLSDNSLPWQLPTISGQLALDFTSINPTDGTTDKEFAFFRSMNVRATSVPEPGTLGLMGLAAAMLLGELVRRRATGARVNLLHVAAGETGPQCV